jgi:hypothetical protein
MTSATVSICRKFCLLVQGKEREWARVLRDSTGVWKEAGTRKLENMSQWATSPGPVAVTKLEESEEDIDTNSGQKTLAETQEYVVM